MLSLKLLIKLSINLSLKLSLKVDVILDAVFGVVLDRVADDPVVMLWSINVDLQHNEFPCRWWGSDAKSFSCQIFCG